MSVFDIFKNKRFDNIIKQYDNSISKISKTKPNADNKYNDSVVSDVIRKSLDDKYSEDLTSLSGMFKAVTVSSQRLQRYGVYDELYSGVQLIKKIINIYLDNILQSNTYSNKYIICRYSEESKDTGEHVEYKNFCEKVIQFYNLEDRFRNKTAFNVLKYGDGFIETLDLDSIVAKFPKPTNDNKKKNNPRNLKIERLPNPNNTNLKTKISKQQGFLAKIGSKNKYGSLQIEDFSEIIENYIDFLDSPLEETHTYYDNLIDMDDVSESNSDNINFNTPYNFSRILLKFHRPHEIVPLVTEYDTIIGYVEISNSAGSTNKNSYNTLMNFANLINQISSSAHSSGKNNSQDQQDEIVRKFADSVVFKVLDKYNVKLPTKQTTNAEYDKSVKSQLDDAVYYALKRLVVSSDKSSLFEEKLQVRFISPENMFHFKNPNGDFYPFGMSIIDPLIFPGKLYLLGQLSNAVNKLSRASVLRKWTIETGAREDTNKLVQNLKRDIRNKRITVEDLSSSKNISNILSDYRDMITFRKRGQPMLDVDTLQMGNPNTSIQDIQDLRQEIISLSGIPSSYLGFQDMADLRDQLVHANINFANSISVIQHNFNGELSRMFYRIAELSSFKSKNIEEYVKITLPPPITLTLQLMESTLNSLSTIQRVFNEIPEISIDPMYLIKRMCPYIDWAEFEKEAQDFKNRKGTGNKMKGGGNQMGGGMGGF